MRQHFGSPSRQTSAPRPSTGFDEWRDGPRRARRWRGRAIAGAVVIAVLAASTASCTLLSRRHAASRVHTLFGDRTPQRDTDPDTKPVELGVKFRSAQAGTITGVRFYKSAANRGSHVGNLWTGTGQLLASARFDDTDNDDTGWRSVSFAEPVPIAAGAAYVASYFAPQGNYAADTGFFSRETTSGPLTAPGESPAEHTSLYAYGQGTSFPTETWQAANYWVDVTFSEEVGDKPPVTATTTTTTTTTTSTTTTTTTAPPTTARPAAPPPPGAAPAGGRGAVSCALNYAAKACWESQTGVPGYTKAQITAGQSPLQRRTGVIAVREAGTVIDGIWLDGCIAVYANNVTIKNSYLKATDPNNWQCQGGNGQATGSVVNSGNGGVSGLKIIDTEIDGGDRAGYVGGVGAAGYTCERCNIHGFTIQMWAGANVSILESFIHDNNRNNGEHHADGIMADSGRNVTIRHNWIAMDGGRGATTAALNIGASWNAPSAIVVENNFLAGFGGADINSDPNGANVRVTNNALSNRNGYEGSLFVSGKIPSGSGNYVAETNAPFRV